MLLHAPQTTSRFKKIIDQVAPGVEVFPFNFPQQDVLIGQPVRYQNLIIPESRIKTAYKVTAKHITEIEYHSIDLNNDLFFNYKKICHSHGLIFDKEEAIQKHNKLKQIRRDNILDLQRSLGQESNPRTVWIIKNKQVHQLVFDFKYKGDLYFLGEKVGHKTNYYSSQWEAAEELKYILEDKKSIKNK